MKAKITAASIVTLSILTATSSAVTLFTESFESPSVTGVTNTVPTGWVGSDQGFNSNRRGTANEDSPLFTTPYGSQAAVVRFFDNAGLVTQADAIGDIVAGVTYTMSFNIAAGGTNYGYLIELVALDELAARNDVRGGNLGTTLISFSSAAVDGSPSGGISTNDMSQSFSASFTANSGDPFIGEDLAIVIYSRQSNEVFYDNILITDNIPEPSIALLGGLGILGILRRRRS